MREEVERTRKASWLPRVCSVSIGRKASGFADFAFFTRRSLDAPGRQGNLTKRDTHDRSAPQNKDVPPHPSRRPCAAWSASCAAGSTRPAPLTPILHPSPRATLDTLRRPAPPLGPDASRRLIGPCFCSSCSCPALLVCPVFPIDPCIPPLVLAFPPLSCLLSHSPSPPRCSRPGRVRARIGQARPPRPPPCGTAGAPADRPVSGAEDPRRYARPRQHRPDQPRTPLRLLPAGRDMGVADVGLYAASQENTHDQLI